MGKIKVFRDKNQDYKRTGDFIYEGKDFYIDQHWGGNAPNYNDIELWSAGCLVGRTKAGHEEFMKIIKQDPRYIKNKRYSFSSIVIDGTDLFKKYPL
ncbi:MAG TPA: hypothetical protein DCY91_13430 [Cyanobacteria bacterium UBA11370]|nr:hypothetical protein [Cyanobacteria bacterium UBA11370]HBY78340.1 hypothetical protein [Cyanobacteria bacterium UBA11148]